MAVCVVASRKRREQLDLIKNVQPSFVIFHVHTHTHLLESDVAF